MSLEVKVVEPGGKVQQGVRGVLSPNISSRACSCHSRYTLLILAAFCGRMIIYKMSMAWRKSFHCGSFIVMGGLVFGKISEESFVVSWEAFQAQGSSLINQTFPFPFLVIGGKSVPVN